MKKSHKKVNKKIVALAIIVFLLVACGVVILILDAIKRQINIFIWVGIYSALLFALVLTLTMIRYERLREIRKDFKNTNLPLYTDNTTLLVQDIIDEKENHN